MSQARSFEFSLLTWMSYARAAPDKREDGVRTASFVLSEFGKYAPLFREVEPGYQEAVLTRSELEALLRDQRFYFAHERPPIFPGASWPILRRGQNTYARLFDADDPRWVRER